jgi:hypothetical protein
MDNYIYLNWVLFFSTKQSLNIFSMLQLVSNQIQEKLHPYFITGFSDGESSFIVTIFKNKEYKCGYQVQAIFQIGLHQKDLELLYKIQSFFGVGTIRLYKANNIAYYCVAGQNELIEIVIPHFLKYPLLTQKKADFLLFKSIVELIINKDHLTIEGLNKILNIKAVINKGLSKELIELFPNIIPVNRPIIETSDIPDPN